MRLPNLIAVLIGNALIGLREGLEAALVVTVLVAFLVRTGRRSSLPMVWAGAGGAVLLSVLAGGLVAYARDPHRQFVPMQRALSSRDVMMEYLEHTGSAVFAVPPGVRPGGRWGDNLLR